MLRPTMTEPTQKSDHGRTARTPMHIPGRGWIDILRRLRREIVEDNLLLYASSFAFYSFLALFPALAALLSLYGLFVNPAGVERMLDAGAGLLPDAALKLLRQQVRALAGYSARGLGVSLFVSLLFTLWAATNGVKALMAGLNTAYEQRETRGVLRFNGTAIALATVGVVFVLIALALIAALPALFKWIELFPAKRVVAWVRWPVLTVAMILALAMVYRFGPCRRLARWRWVSGGAVLATLLWISVSILFSFYVANLGTYDRAYGTLGAIVMLLLWFYLSALVVLIGAEFNSEVERQTAIDTTVGPARPLGQRGATVADTIDNR